MNEGQRVIICGSRSITDYALVESIIENSGFNIGTVVSGCADGVDTLGEMYAQINNIPIDPYPVLKEDQKRYGYKLAPKRRNSRMVANADGVIAIHNGSSGTMDCVEKARYAGLSVCEVILADNLD